jgi:hypothetical protein
MTSIRPRDARQALVDHPLDLRAPRSDGPWREAVAHQLPEPGVRRRILLEHEVARARLLLVHARQLAAQRSDAGWDLVQQAVDVGVARETPEADRRLVHRIDLSQPGEGRVGIVANHRIEQVRAHPGIARVCRHRHALPATRCGRRSQCGGRTAAERACGDARALLARCRRDMSGRPHAAPSP